MAQAKLWQSFYSSPSNAHSSIFCSLFQSAKAFIIIVLLQLCLSSEWAFARAVHTLGKVFAGCTDHSNRSQHERDFILRIQGLWYGDGRGFGHRNTGSSPERKNTRRLRDEEPQNGERAGEENLYCREVKLGDRGGHRTPAAQHTCRQVKRRSFILQISQIRKLRKFSWDHYHKHQILHCKNLNLSTVCVIFWVKSVF